MEEMLNFVRISKIQKGWGVHQDVCQSLDSVKKKSQNMGNAVGDERTQILEHQE